MPLQQDRWKEALGAVCFEGSEGLSSSAQEARGSLVALWLNARV